MNQITDMWSNLSMMYKIGIGVLVLVVLYYVYNQYQLSEVENYAAIGGGENMPENFGPGSVGQTTGEGGQIVCTMYYVDWCPHCKTAKPEWEQLMQNYNGKVVNGKKVLVLKINCEENPEAAKRDNIDGYPTFKFNMDGKYHDYSDERVYDKFESFLHYLAQM